MQFFVGGTFVSRNFAGGVVFGFFGLQDFFVGLMCGVLIFCGCDSSALCASE